MKSAAVPQRKSAGFALVPALFLIVVLAALAAVAVRLGAGEQHAVTMELVQARAMASARAGVEWGAYEALKVANGCTSSTSLNLTEQSLNGFTVLVNCTATPFADGSGFTSYVVQATATYGIYGQPGYVRRVFSSTFTDAT